MKPAVQTSAASNTNKCAPVTRTRAVVLGAALDVGNRGVLALGVSVARLLSQGCPGVEIAFHYGHDRGGRRRLGTIGTEPLEVRVVNCRMSPRSAPAQHILVILALACLYRLGMRGPARRNEWLRSLLEADFIGDIRGGDSFSDIYGFRRFLEGSLPLLSVVLLGRPYTMLPQTYGPFRSSAARGLARLLLTRAAEIYTRDKNCAPLVVSLSGRSPQFCPDVAFTMEAIKPDLLEFAPGGVTLDGDHPVIGINVSGLLYMGGYTGRNMFGLRSEYRELVDVLIDRLLACTPANVLLVPHVFGPEEREEEACAAILQSIGSRHPGRVFAVRGPLSERELKWVVGRTQFFIGSRMHACIAALSQGVPAIGLAYSDKFLGVFESVGMGGSTVDLRKLETLDITSKILLDWNRREEFRIELRERIPSVKAAVVETFRSLRAA